MKLTEILLVAAIGLVCVTSAEPADLKKVSKDDYRLMADHKELAELMPDAWQGNLNILSPKQ